MSHCALCMLDYAAAAIKQHSVNDETLSYLTEPAFKFSKDLAEKMLKI